MEERIAGENMLAENVARSVINNANVVRQRGAIRAAEYNYKQQKLVRDAYNQLQAEEAWVPRTNNAIQEEIMGDIEANEGRDAAAAARRHSEEEAKAARRQAQREQENAARARKEQKAAEVRAAEEARQRAEQEKKAAAAAKKAAKRAAKAAGVGAAAPNENNAALSAALAQANAEREGMAENAYMNIIRQLKGRVDALKATFNALGAIRFILIPDERSAATGGRTGIYGQVALLGLDGSANPAFISYWSNDRVKNTLTEASFERLAFYKRLLEIATAHGEGGNEIRNAIRKYLISIQTFFTYFDSTTDEAVAAAFKEATRTKSTKGAAPVAQSRTLDKVLNAVYTSENELINLLYSEKMRNLAADMSVAEIESLLSITANMFRNYEPLLIYASEATGIGKNNSGGAAGGGGAGAGRGGRRKTLRKRTRKTKTRRHAKK